jgi:rod shape-determining protein MreD
MRRPLLFGVSTLVLGWALQTMSFYIFGPLSSPQWLVIAVVALGGRGRADMAMTLGYFWGLYLDVFSLSPFGAQAWLTALLGYTAGKLSRQLDPGKTVTQVSLAAVVSVAYPWGLHQLENGFRPDPAHGVALWSLAGVAALNVAAAPFVFGLLEIWMDFWIRVEDRYGHV